MTDGTGPGPGAPPPQRTVIRSLLRAVGTTVVLVALYYLMPFDRVSSWAAITILVIGLVALIVLIVLQVRSIVRSPFPGLRAIEALATSIPLFLLLFAAAYSVMTRLSPGSFSAPLSRTDALYFAVTVFSTVGFGDITAKTDTARLVVTGQMVADIVIVGLAVKAITGAVSQGRQRRTGDASSAQPGE